MVSLDPSFCRFEQIQCLNWSVMCANKGMISQVRTIIFIGTRLFGRNQKQTYGDLFPQWTISYRCVEGRCLQQVTLVFVLKLARLI